MIAFDHHAITINGETAEMHPAGGGRDVPFIANSKRVIVDDDGTIVCGS